jgi:hypothetical protein
MPLSGSFLFEALEEARNEYPFDRLECPKWQLTNEK